MIMGLERRKFPRRPFHRAVSLLVGGNYHCLRGHEIGEGGLSLNTAFDVPVERKVVLNFQIPDGSFISVKAEVRNSRPSDQGGFILGCAFSNLSFEKRREIRTLVSK
jgi:hypothetical protein